MLGGGQYEYAIDGQAQQQPPSSKGSNQIGKSTSQSSNAGSSLPKRTPHSELTSY